MFDNSSYLHIDGETNDWSFVSPTIFDDNCLSIDNSVAIDKNGDSFTLKFFGANSGEEVITLKAVSGTKLSLRNHLSQEISCNYLS